MGDERHFFFRSSKLLGLTPLTGECIKNSIKSAINDYILVEGPFANYDDFMIVLRIHRRLRKFKKKQQSV